MRQYAFLKEPLRRSDGSRVCRIMMYEDAEGIWLFEYDTPDAVMCSADRLYGSREDLDDDWADLVDEGGWIRIPDPLPDCQHDALLPVRVKGRDTGKPEWGRFEILRDGRWEAYEYPPRTPGAED